MAGVVVLAGLLALAPAGSISVISPSEATKPQSKPMAKPANQPCPQLEPLRPAEPTPAQRAMPGSF